MEYLPIVNEEDEIIDCKERGSLNPEDIYRVSALWIQNSKGEFLLAQRAYDKKKDPGMWGPAVAGTVAKNESYEHNILRESWEELGLRNINPIKSIKQRVKMPHNYFVQWFLLKLDKALGDFNIREAEVASIRWFNKKELFDLLQQDKLVVQSLKPFVSYLIKNE